MILINKIINNRLLAKNNKERYYKLIMKYSDCRIIIRAVNLGYKELLKIHNIKNPSLITLLKFYDINK
jgi:hypothetical protein